MKKCYVEGCENGTRERCSVCAKPVCREHVEKRYATSSLAIPFMGFVGDEYMCIECASKLERERELAARRLRIVK